LKQQTCVLNPTHYDKKIFLSLGNKGYFCQLGCPGVLDGKGMERHLVSSHSKEELWRWSINYDKLVSAISSSSKPLKSSISVCKVQYENDTEILQYSNDG
jgi:hypothetical protein